VNKILTYNFGEDFISNLADHIEENIIKKGRNMAKTAIIFGGKRPELFLKKELSKRIKNTYFPPQFFSIDEFMRYIVSRKEIFSKISDLDACYIIYKIVVEKAPTILHNNTLFSQFLPWAKEISSFIDELDLEDIQNDKLNTIQKSAEIGYDIPLSINILLKNIIIIRQEYHKELSKRQYLTRGLLYNKAAKLIKEIDFNEFDEILFCNFFYMHKTEESIAKHLYETKKSSMLFQADGHKWNCLDTLAKSLNCRIEPQKTKEPQNNIEIYSGFDTHSQTGIVRSEILSKIKNPEKTVIVLPDPETLIPLLSELPPEIKEFNVSMGYPLKRSSIYTLFKSIIEAQISYKNNSYYTKDYLKVLMHPLIKNLHINTSPSITRTLAHKVEEILLGIETTELSKHLFINLSDIQKLDKVYAITEDNLAGQNTNKNTLKEILSEAHSIAFTQWENISNFTSLCTAVNNLLDILITKSFAENYPLNLKVIEKIYNINETLKNVEFKNENFDKMEIFKIFQSMLDRELIAFKGSPLKGLQILGLLETRTLSFENVIIMDANESVLPKLKPFDPLIPRQAIAGLGLNRFEQEEEIQRYHFMRLINSAKNVYITYNNSPEKEKSRFIEELIWEKQKKENKINVLSEHKAKFKIKVLPEKPFISKNTEILKTLENISFSPSSIDTYITCPLQFYYKYVLGLKEKEEISDEPQATEIGNFLHELLEYSFKEFTGKEPVIDNKFIIKFYKYFDAKFKKELVSRIGSDAFMVKKVMEYKLANFLKSEAKRSAEIKQIIGLEDGSFGTKINFKNRNIKFKCRIDRIDELHDGSIFIIDYKSGSSAKTPSGVQKLAEWQKDRKWIREKIHSFQLPLYCYFAQQKYKNTPVNAGLYNLKDAKITNFIKDKEEDSAETKIEKCMDALEFIIEEIFNPEKPFLAEESSERICEYCPFIYMCR
jgi:hypothetical protein